MISWSAIDSVHRSNFQTWTKGAKLTEIKVLSPGCPNCEELKKRTEQASKELAITAEVNKITHWRK